MTLRESVRKRPGMYFGFERDLLSLLQGFFWHGGIAGQLDSFTVAVDDEVTLSLEGVAVDRARACDVPSERDLGDSPLSWVAIIEAASTRFEKTFESARMTVRFSPDVAVLPDWRATRSIVGALRNLATAYPKLRVAIRDRAHGLDVSATYARGALDRLEEERAQRSTNHAPVHLTHSECDVHVDVAFAWCHGPGLQLVALVNGERTPNGGSHVLGVWEGIADAIEAELPRSETRPRMLERNVPRGAMLVVSVRAPDPSWGPATKDCLHDERVREVVRRCVGARFGDALGREWWSGSKLPWQMLGGWHNREAWLPQLAEALVAREVDSWPDVYVHRADEVRC